MKKTLIALSVVFALAAVFAMAPEAPATEMKAEIDMEAAKATFENRCSVCHGTDRPLGKNKDRAGWEKTVKRMAGKKPFPEEEQELIIDYLTKIRGPKM